MTEREKQAIAHELSYAHSRALSLECKMAMKMLMVHIADALKVYGGRFDRGHFLKLSGHPDYTTGEYKPT